MKILLGVSHSGTVPFDTARSIWKCSEEHEVQVAGLSSSLLAMGFNALLCDALNRNEAGEGVTHMAMLHSDIAADGPWIDTLVRIAEERQADFVSVVNAIKDDRALTSTGVGMMEIPWKPFRRFTMRELVRWPETFDAADVGYAGFVLLHNTGCWLADLRSPIFHQTDEEGRLRAFFTINDQVVRRNGTWRAEVEPEDWFFSKRIHELGAKSCVTREVSTHHFGICDCDNQTERGTRETDTDVMHEWNETFLEIFNADSRGGLAGDNSRRDSAGVSA
jgi:hypothetical protein